MSYQVRSNSDPASLPGKTIPLFFSDDQPRAKLTHKMNYLIFFTNRGGWVECLRAFNTLVLLPIIPRLHPPL